MTSLIKAALDHMRSVHERRVREYMDMSRAGRFHGDRKSAH